MPFGYMLAPAEKESKTADKNFKLCIQMFVNGVAKKKLLIEFYSSIGLMQFSKWRKNVIYSIFLMRHYFWKLYSQRQTFVTITRCDDVDNDNLILKFFTWLAVSLTNYSFHGGFKVY